MTTWKQKTSELAELLKRIEFTDRSGKLLDVEIGFNELKGLTESLLMSHKTLFSIGNGASATMANHFSADLGKNGKLHTHAFCNLALLTAVSNDISYEEVYSEPLRRNGHEGDLLVTISSSGNSPNLIKAIEAAKDLSIKVVTLSAMSPNNLTRKMGDVNIYIPATDYGNAETSHAAILHHWVDLAIQYS